MAETTTEKTAPALAQPAAKKAVDAVPEGHRRVMWVYCAADTSKNGTVEDVDASTAASLVDENRAKYVPAETPLGALDQPTRR